MKCTNCGTEFDGKFCPQCGQAPTPEVSPEAQTPPAQPKKPFYKRVWFIVAAAIVLCAVIAKACSGGSSSDTGTGYNWESFSLSQALPKPASDTCDSYSETDNSLQITLCNTSEDDFNAYVQECMETYGFTQNKLQSTGSFSADNGTYFLSVNYNSTREKMDIILSTLSGETPTEAATQATESRQKQSTQKSGSEEKSTPAATEAKQPEEKSSGLRSDFKEAMDSYESFMNEYITFMEKYNKSGGADVSLITDYTNYLSKYADVVAKFEKWDSEDLNDEEAIYYLEVQTRVAKKLADASIK